LNIPVHILVTCRNPDLFAASALVFDTIRTGFPTARIIVTGNALDLEQEDEIRKHVERIKGGFANLYHVMHHEWIARLIANELDPFIICDTDIIFWQNMEGFLFRGPMHGRRVPAFRCPVTETDTMDRLHTALLYIEPEAFLEYRRQKDENPAATLHPCFTPMDLVDPVRFAMRMPGRIWHHDTLGQAYHVLGGEPFSEEILNCYDHVSCGTYLDLLDEKIPGSRERQMEYVRHPETARGLWRKQQKYLESRSI